MSISVEQIKIPDPVKIRTSRKEREKDGAPADNIPFDPEYAPGARNAVNVCLRVQPDEKVCVITDEATIEIAAAMVRELEKLGAPYHAWVLEDLAARPLTDLPREILDDLETSQVSIFAVQAQTNELRSRMQMTDVVNRRKIRHAHMVNINRQIMLEGMRADFAARGPAQPEGGGDGAQGVEDSGENGCGDGSDGGFESELQVAEDQRDYHSGKMGQPAGRRNFHYAGRGEWNVCD